MRALIPWRPWEIETVGQRMEDLFDRMSHRFFGPWERERASGNGKAWSPDIESHVENGNLVVKADLPGIDPKEVSISVSGNELRIEGERKQEEKTEEKDYFYHELAYGKFVRTMPLPADVEAEQVTARYKDGVLEITMPAPKALITKKIQIEAQ